MKLPKCSTPHFLSYFIPGLSLIWGSMDHLLRNHCKLTTSQKSLPGQVFNQFDFLNLLCYNLWIKASVIWQFFSPLCFKGQLISKCIFGAFKFFQKTNENKSTWGIIVVKSNFFVRFLEELKTTKRHFEINWPLVTLVI